MTGAKPEEMPNEPKMYPYQGQSIGKNLDGFAEKAPVKGAEQLDHVSVPIDPVDIFGEQAKDSRPLHTDTKMPSGPKQGDFANKNLKGPVPGSKIKNSKV